LLLTLNGPAEVVVQDAASCQRLLERVQKPGTRVKGAHEHMPEHELGVMQGGRA